MSSEGQHYGGVTYTPLVHNIRTKEVLRFHNVLRRHLPHGFTLIWDRHRPHRATLVTTWLAKYVQTIRVEWLPPYAPDLNPAEHIKWSHTKHRDLANFAPADLDHLGGAVVTSLVPAPAPRPVLPRGGLGPVKCTITYT